MPYGPVQPLIRSSIACADVQLAERGTRRLGPLKLPSGVASSPPPRACTQSLIPHCPAVCWNSGRSNSECLPTSLELSGKIGRFVGQEVR
ncbi:unnamed protein product [Calypogeia fissa]